MLTLNHYHCCAFHTTAKQKNKKKIGMTKEEIIQKNKAKKSEDKKAKIKSLLEVCRTVLYWFLIRNRLGEQSCLLYKCVWCKVSSLCFYHCSSFVN